MKRGINTLIALAFLYLVYLVVKIFVLRKKFAMSRDKKAAMKGAAKGQKVPNSARHTVKNPVKNAEETALDPVCGNYVPISSAVSLASARETVYFCSSSCRDAFMADAQRHGS